MGNGARRVVLMSIGRDLLVFYIGQQKDLKRRGRGWRGDWVDVRPVT